MIWYEKLVLAILIDFVLSMWHNKISYKICLNKIRFWLECMVLPSLSVSNVLMICLLQCYNPQEYEIHTGHKPLKNGLSVCFIICYHILICIWTLEWTSGTCFVYVRMSIQFLASSTDRIVTGHSYFQIHLTCVMIWRIRPRYTHRLCPFNVTQQDFV